LCLAGTSQAHLAALEALDIASTQPNPLEPGSLVSSGISLSATSNIFSVSILATGMKIIHDHISMAEKNVSDSMDGRYQHPSREHMVE
jgi:hypothetical protein